MGRVYQGGAHRHRTTPRGTLVPVGPRRKHRQSFGLSQGLFVVVGMLGLGIIGVGVWRFTAPVPAAALSSDRPSPPPGPSSGVVDLASPAPDATGVAATTALCPGCDILLITACSLRKDHIGAYGLFPALTPAADELADGGVRFDRAFAASNFTLASLTAVLTGRFGSSSGVTGWDKGLGDGVPTLAEVLGIYGYRTGAFSVDAPSGFRPDYGLHRGFQVMKVIATPRDTPDGRWRGGPIGPGGASAEPVVQWLEDSTRTPQQSLFTMFHTRTAHFPFVIEEDTSDPTGISQGLWEAGRTPVAPPSGGAMPGMAGGTAQQGVVELAGVDPLQTTLQAGGPAAEAMWRQRYQEAVGRMDIDLRRVLDALEAAGRADRTIVVLVGDHGESLNDHGEMLHGDAYYTSVSNVPLLMKVPGLSGGPAVQGALVSHVDILPTLLELIGATAPADIDGVSMVPLLTGQATAIRSTTLVEGGVAKQNSDVLRGAVITDRWALLRQQRGCGAPPKPGPGGRWEPMDCLFDLNVDMAQEHNVAAAHPDVVQELLGRWSAFRSARQSSARQFDLDPAFVEELQRTGYDLHKDPVEPGPQ